MTSLLRPLWRRVTLALTLCVLSVLACSTPVRADEVITHFDADIEVQRDLAAVITETITVRAEGDAITRGIFRDIPTRLRSASGGYFDQELEVLSVRRDGEVEPFKLSSLSTGKRLRIGSSGTTLRPGLHTYEIRYRMERAARMFSGHDELYWNTTGNYWQFPIEQATARVHMPAGANIVEMNVYTGRRGEQGDAATAERLSDNEARFATTAPLAINEGMTVSVAIDKGVLVAPSGRQAFDYWFEDNRHIIIPGVLLLLVLVYNWGVWARVGRDPKKGVIIPRFYPPLGFSPALVHYIDQMGWTKNGWNAFSAALVSLATKGLVRIGKDESKKKGKETTVLTVNQDVPVPDLPKGERIIFRFLAEHNPVNIDSRQGPKLNRLRKRFIAALQTESHAVYFNKNRGFVVMGWGIAIAALAAMAVTMGGGEALLLLLFTALFTAIPLIFFRAFFYMLWQWSLVGRLIVIAVGILLLPSLLSTFTLFFTSWSFLELFPLWASIGIVLITSVFSRLVHAPTVHGREIMDQIEGFKLYLETAERERLNFQDEPALTTNRFEEMLPYAMALGVEKPWSEYFENELARRSQAAGTGSSVTLYSPSWYHGGDISAAGIAATMAGIGSGLDSAIGSSLPSSSTSSSSSSGMGGGGSSGGGGGGGGGGGW